MDLDTAEVWTTYALDAADALRDIEESLLELERRGADKEEVNRLSRGLHTLKGNSGLMSLSEIERLAHAAEDLIGLVRDHGAELDADIVEVLLEVVDVLGVVVADAGEHHRDASPARVGDLVARVREVEAATKAKSGGPQVASPPNVDRAPNVDETEAEEAPRSASIARDEPPVRYSELDRIVKALPDDAFYEAESPATRLDAADDDPTVDEDSMIDPSSDIEYVTIFLEMARDLMMELGNEVPRLMIAEEIQDATAKIIALCSDLGLAADRMGFVHIVDILDQLVSSVDDKKTAATNAPAVELELHSALVAIAELRPEVKAEGLITIYRRACANMVFPDLAELRSYADGESPLPASHAAQQLFHRLRAACDYYGLANAIRRCLETEDLFGRELMGARDGVSEATADVINHLVEDIGSAVYRVNAGEENVDVPAPPPEADATMRFHPDIAAMPMSEEVRAQLPQTGLALLTERYLRGEAVIEVAIDLDCDTKLAELFLAWLEAERVDLITTAVTASAERVEGYRFLVVVPEYGAGLPTGFAAVNERAKVVNASLAVNRLRVNVAETLDRDAPANSLAPNRERERQRAAQPSAPREEPKAANGSPATKPSTGPSANGFHAPAPNGLHAPAPNGLHAPAPNGLHAPSDAKNGRESKGRAASTDDAQHGGPKRPAGGELDDEPGASRASARADFLRIDGRKVSHIMDIAGELGLACGAVVHHPEIQGLDLRGFTAAAHKLEMLVRELQNEVSAMRLVPVVGVFAKMRRVVRDTARRTGKKVELVLIGEDTEIDKVMVDELGDPLIHIVRNAIDHGLETPEDRKAAGKSETGRVIIEASHQGGEVSVQVRDDGRGLNREKIFARAVERGVVSPDAVLSDQEIMSLIFQPGFSTKDEISELSGRGVGMDVVRSSIEHRLRGRVTVQSTPGRGTRIHMAMPLTLAFIEAMVVRIGDRLFALPIERVFEVFKVRAEQLAQNSADGEVLIAVREKLVPVCWLERFYEGACVPDQRSLEGRIVVVVQTALGSLALPVDHLLGNQQIMLKPMKGVLASIRAAAGCGMLRTGDVAVTLDCEQLRA